MCWDSRIRNIIEAVSEWDELQLIERMPSVMNDNCRAVSSHDWPLGQPNVAHFSEAEHQTPSGLHPFAWSSVSTIDLPGQRDSSFNIGYSPASSIVISSKSQEDQSTAKHRGQRQVPARLTRTIHILCFPEQHPPVTYPPQSYSSPSTSTNAVKICTLRWVRTKECSGWIEVHDPNWSCSSLSIMVNKVNPARRNFHGKTICPAVR